jgi:hypothetical protein
MEITLKDMSKIYPSYSPEHRQPVLEYYAKMFELGLIAAWKVI